MEDLISREAALDALGECPLTWTGGDYELGCRNQYDTDRLAIETVPSAQQIPEQWQELKETVIELRDNDGTGTQHDICTFLVNYMNILEKQMREEQDE